MLLLLLVFRQNLTLVFLLVFFIRRRCKILYGRADFYMCMLIALAIYVDSFQIFPFFLPLQNSFFPEMVKIIISHTYRVYLNGFSTFFFVSFILNCYLFFALSLCLSRQLLPNASHGRGACDMCGKYI